MIRVVVYLILVGALAAGAVWVADRPGDVAITWQGMRIETSVMVMLIGLIAAMALAVALWSLLRLVLNSPRLVARSWRARRGARGFHALSGGLVAVGAGDAQTARRFADEARRIAPKEPLTLLLTAQVAQMNGDGAEAERTFRAMAARDETKLLGLHGLFVEARRRGDAAAARLIAEEAAQTSPALDWAGRASLEFRSLAGDWTGALDNLDRNYKHGLLDKAAWRRQRAVLLTARAIARDEGHDTGLHDLGQQETAREAAKADVLEAVKLAPDLPPAAVLAGRLLGENNELRKGARLLEAAWKAHPHPDIAAAYAHLRFGDSTQDRLARVKTLVRRTPGNAEGALALARAALEAHDFKLARETLQTLLAMPTRRVALMMAELERAEHGDEGRAREWTARAAYAAPDPAWTADGVVSERWLPVSPVSGRIDAFHWRVPVTELGVERPVLELTDPADLTVAEAEADADALAVPADLSAPAAEVSVSEPPAGVHRSPLPAGRPEADQQSGDGRPQPAAARAASAGPSGNGTASQRPGAGPRNDALGDISARTPAEPQAGTPTRPPGAEAGGTPASRRDGLSNAADTAAPMAADPTAARGAVPGSRTPKGELPRGAAAAKPAGAPSTVIPLTRAPDDPGPDADPLAADDQTSKPRRMPL
ncbi:MAG TPA: heme biosynthesis HemY N-terminal domain-containing protein [Xanthobacteraceae bacterium]|nr:heme biosynthesis HemY N-terminal domain-containing protein [Xanthobacteraceae bacterium]